MELLADHIATKLENRKVSAVTVVDDFTVMSNSHAASDQEVAKILADPGFGKYFTDHMVTIEFDERIGWHDAQVRPRQDLLLAPEAAVLHYGQAVFEGLKAYQQPDRSVACFRPDMHAARLRTSARRLAMPELPTSIFLASITRLLDADRRWLPADDGKSLYLRPFMIATSRGLNVTPADEYLYTVIASPSAPYFGDVLRPVTVWVSREYVRAAPGGTGSAKYPGNYGAAFIAQIEAREHGCDQVVWLDAIERRWVEEMGAMNLFFVFGSGRQARIVTPELSGSLLPGVTRDSLLTLARDEGLTVQERRVSIEEWIRTAATGELTEVFACGTASVVSPVGRVRYAQGEATIGDQAAGPVTSRLRRRLTAIQAGSAPDPYGWMRTLLQ
ncbi:MAG: branched chain amino acid aminotransferase [Actinomycetia bacterium]|nr:branched chain amino acid aminotransferase [Actinomycetes bacterium]